MSSKNYNETPAYRVLVEHSPRQSEELYLTLCGIEQCRPDKERESRVRDGFHLHVVLSGNGTLEAEGVNARLREGQLFLIKPGEKITYYPDPQNPWAYCWMSFSGAQADALMREAGFVEGVYALESHVHVSKFYQLCDAALETPQLTHAAALRRYGLMLQYIAAAIESNDWECGSRKLKGHRPLQNRQDYTRYAIDYIKNNYSSITLRDVSDYLGINYNYFRLRGLDPEGRYRLAEMVAAGCDAPDGVYLCGQAMAGRVFTGASLMYAGFTLRPMRGDYPGVQLLFERVDAKER